MSISLVFLIFIILLHRAIEPVAPINIQTTYLLTYLVLTYWKVFIQWSNLSNFQHTF